MRSPLPRSWPASGSRPCACTSSTAWSRPRVAPAGTRRYSGEDLTRLHRITTLTGDGVNLTAVARILELEDTVARLRAERDRLRAKST